MKKKNINNYKDFINEFFRYDTKSLIGKIDYTLLKPEATKSDILELCQKADKLGVKAVCILPKMVKTASVALKGSKVLVCTVVSFPEGTDSTEEKIRETTQAISEGADEIDVVMNYQLLKPSKKSEGERASDIQYIENELDQVVKLCHKKKNKQSQPVTVKIIIECGLLSDQETRMATDSCDMCNAGFIKTSTGVTTGSESDKVKITRDVI